MMTELLEKDGAENELEQNDDFELVLTSKGVVWEKKFEKTFADIAEPLIPTKGWKFCREEANAR